MLFLLISGVPHALSWGHISFENFSLEIRSESAHCRGYTAQFFFLATYRFGEI